MNTKQLLKSTRKKPKQFKWDMETEGLFMELATAYDETLSINMAILKLIKQAIKDWYLPGYERKERPTKHVISNELDTKLDNLKNNDLTKSGYSGILIRKSKT